MLRSKAINRQLGHERDFFWRGGDVSRIEGLSDAVFAFAITLLVVSLEVPNSFTELYRTMQGFVAFGVTFAFVIWIWYEHYLFFRRYGLQDVKTIVLNAALLLTLLFYIYPLKFLSTLLITYGVLKLGLGMDIQVDIAMEGEDWGTLMKIYSMGFLVIFLIMVLLYMNAYRLRGSLHLTDVEVNATCNSMTAHGIIVCLAGISIILAIVVPLNQMAWAGLIYWLIGPLLAVNGIYYGRRGKRLLQQQEKPLT